LHFSQKPLPRLDGVEHPWVGEKSPDSGSLLFTEYLLPRRLDGEAAGPAPCSSSRGWSPPTSGSSPASWSPQLPEIWREGWTVDMRRRKPKNLLIDDTPIGGTRIASGLYVSYPLFARRLFEGSPWPMLRNRNGARADAFSHQSVKRSSRVVLPRPLQGKISIPRTASA
jgi:hypothetical protein